jgi:hypothetical protein
MQVRTRLNVNLHVLVFAVSGFAVFYAAARAIGVWELTRHGAAYRQAVFVVERVVEQDGVRWAEGRVEPAGKPYRYLVHRTLEGGMVLHDDRAVRAEPGARMRIWWTDAEAHSPSVASAPCIPGKRLIAFWILFAVALLFAGMRLTMLAGEALQAR